MRANFPNRALLIEVSNPYCQEGEEFQEKSPVEEIFNFYKEVEDKDDSLACAQVMRKTFV